MAHAPLTGNNGVQRWRNHKGDYYREDGPAQVDCLWSIAATLEWLSYDLDKDGLCRAHWSRFMQLANTRRLAFDLIEGGSYRERFYA